jgi:hypothetical protein
VLQVEAHADGSLAPGQVLADCAEEAEFEHDGGLDVADELSIVSAYPVGQSCLQRSLTHRVRCFT